MKLCVTNSLSFVPQLLLKWIDKTRLLNINKSAKTRSRVDFIYEAIAEEVFIHGIQFTLR